jgi:hypothetical protein
VLTQILFDDGEFGVRGLGINGGAPAAWDQFMVGLVEAFQKAQGIPATVHTLEDHDRSIRAQVNGHPIISLDPRVKFPRGKNLGVSREFQPGGAINAGLTARPGRESIREQIDRIPHDRHWLVVDDCVFTGGTVRRVIDLLRESGVTVERVVAGIQVGHPSKIDVPVDGIIQYEGERVADLNDAADFLVGAHCSGLVIRLADGRHVRAPYIHPWVDISERCTLPPGSAGEFSLKVWELNLRFWERFPSVRVCDVDPHQRLLLETSGFSRGTRMHHVCRAMIGGRHPRGAKAPVGGP